MGITPFQVPLWLELVAAGLGGLQGALFAAAQRDRRIDVLGVIVIGLAGGRGTVVNRPGILYGLAVGVVIAIYTLWDATAVTIGGMPPAGLYWGSIVFQLLLLAPAALRRRSTLGPMLAQHRVAIIVVGVLSPLSYILVLLAMQLAPVSVVAPAREVSVVLVALGGWLLFREPHPVQRIIGAVIVLVGVGLLAL